MSDRLTRINAAVRDVISEAVTELGDPRIGFVTITYAKVARDFTGVEVGFSVLGANSDRTRTESALNAARGVIQRKIARDVRLRNTPQIHFHYDDTTDTAMRIERLLEETEAGDA
jgi:ribosome-binding factor A